MKSRRQRFKYLADLLLMGSFCTGFHEGISETCGWTRKASLFGSPRKVKLFGMPKLKVSCTPETSFLCVGEV